MALASATPLTTLTSKPVASTFVSIMTLIRMVTLVRALPLTVIDLQTIKFTKDLVKFTIKFNFFFFIYIRISSDKYTERL